MTALWIAVKEVGEDMEQHSEDEEEEGVGGVKVVGSEQRTLLSKLLTRMSPERRYSLLLASWASCPLVNAVICTTANLPGEKRRMPELCAVGAGSQMGWSVVEKSITHQTPPPPGTSSLCLETVSSGQCHVLHPLVEDSWIGFSLEAVFS